MVFLGLGSNLGDRSSYLHRAVEKLQSWEGIEFKAASPIYETEPFGFKRQGAFLNMVVAAETSLAPLALLAACHAIESSLQRERGPRWGPRTIDIDILLFDDMKMRLPELTIPHVFMTKRRFVLVPLLTLAPDVYVDGKSIAQLLADCTDDGEVKFYADFS